MAIAVRIDGVQNTPGGGFSVLYSLGTDPLPAAPMGFGLGFSSKQDMIDFAASLEFDLSGSGIHADVLLRIMISAWRARDATLSTVSQISNHTLTFDAGANALGNVLKIQ